MLDPYKDGDEATLRPGPGEGPLRLGGGVDEGGETKNELGKSGTDSSAFWVAAESHGQEA